MPRSRSSNLLFRSIIAHVIGWCNLKLRVRRSRKDWPSADELILWTKEEVWEYRSRPSTSELIDIAGNVMILQEIYGISDHPIIIVPSIPRKVKKEEVVAWWLRQTKRGRRNLGLILTYKLINQIINEITRQPKKTHTG